MLDWLFDALMLDEHFCLDWFYKHRPAYQLPIVINVVVDRQEQGENCPTSISWPANSSSVVIYACFLNGYLLPLIIGDGLLSTRVFSMYSWRCCAFCATQHATQCIGKYSSKYKLLFKKNKQIIWSTLKSQVFNYAFSYWKKLWFFPPFSLLSSLLNFTIN